MPPTGSQKARTHRMVAAVVALTPLGFSKEHIEAKVKQILNDYGNRESGWYFIDKDYYKLLIERLIEDRENGVNDVINEEDRASAESDAQEALLELGGSSGDRKPPIKEQSLPEREGEALARKKTTSARSHNRRPASWAVGSSRTREISEKGKFLLEIARSEMAEIDAREREIAKKSKFSLERPSIKEEEDDDKFLRAEFQDKPPSAEVAGITVACFSERKEVEEEDEDL